MFLGLNFLYNFDIIFLAKFFLQEIFKGKILNDKKYPRKKNVIKLKKEILRRIALKKNYTKKELPQKIPSK